MRRRLPLKRLKNFSLGTAFHQHITCWVLTAKAKAASIYLLDQKHGEEEKGNSGTFRPTLAGNGHSTRTFGKACKRSEHQSRLTAQVMVIFELAQVKLQTR